MDPEESDGIETTLKAVLLAGMPVLVSVFPIMICLIHFELHAAAAIKQYLISLAGWEQYIQALILISASMVILVFSDLIIVFHIILVLLVVLHSTSSVLEKCRC